MQDRRTRLAKRGEVEDALQRHDIDALTKTVTDGFSGVYARQDKTNGNVLFHTKLFLVVGAVLATLLITNGSELIQVFKLII